MTWHAHARCFGLGRAAYLFWHAPVGALKTSIAAGGPIEQWRDRAARAKMRAAAACLAPQRLPPAAPAWPEIHFLTGEKFWDQTALCLYTLQAHASCSLRTILHDDGSASDDIVARLGRVFPYARWRRPAEAAALLDRHLDAARHPALRERWRVYPNIRKLTDVHLGARGWKLVLDSDMLFFRRPYFLLDWLRAPDRPLHATDVKDSYGYPPALLESLAGAPLPARLNVGICGLRSEDLDWDRLEIWCRRLQEAAGTSYYLEQALVAMLCAGRPCAVAPADDYRVMPTETECRDPQAVLHHYVAGSKRGYYRHAWKLALARSVGQAL
ncbi:MAG: glycosyl transferase family 2 [Opitutaceae bacterium]|nr:glycosyl transferase family 2 [Opitutaceae bacterium]